MSLHAVSVRSGLFALSLLMSATAQAALVGRMADAYGRYQAVYDSDLDITWLADANYAASAGYDADGFMNWTAAQDWIGALNAANHLGAGDWRLPVSDACSGYDCTGSELGHLFYVEFAGEAGYGEPMPPLADPDVALFSNLQTGGYWSGTGYASDAAWAFEFGPYDVGRQIYFPQAAEFYAWAVRAGDIGAGPALTLSSALAVPLPASLGLFGAGLLGLLGVARTRIV